MLFGASYVATKHGYVVLAPKLSSRLGSGSLSDRDPLGNSLAVAPLPSESAPASKF